MTNEAQTEQSLRAENAELRARLAAAEESLRALRGGDAAAPVVESSTAPQVISQQGRDAESNRFRDEILAQVSDAVIAVDDDQRVTYLNAAAERQYGVTASEVLGRHLSEMHEYRWLDPGDEALAMAALRETGHWHGENIHIKRYLGVNFHITERKKLQQELLDISEREQRKFGRDLHDGLGQHLTALEMLSHGLAEDLKAHAPALARQARRLNRELRETVTQARRISHSLAPVTLEGDGLMRGLMALAASTNRIPGVKCQLNCDPALRVADVATATHLYRIAQEAVNNALKHGRATKVDLTLTEQAGGLELSVKNNGRDLPAAQPGNRGIGLNVMRYRAELIGGSLSIESGQRKGVRVTCTLPKK